MSRRLILAALAALVAMPSLALAQGTSTPVIDQRQANQERRIDQGIGSGQVTRREARGLNRQQNHIDRMENRAKADGTVSGQERRRIGKAQNRASANIYRQKHDNQVQPRARR